MSRPSRESQSPQIVARGSHYFEDPFYPLTLRRVDARQDMDAAHEHDLTQVPHSHDFCELSFVTRGQAMHWLEGEEFPITAGDVFVLQSQHRHYYSQLQNLEMVNIMFDPKQLNLPETRLKKIHGYQALFLLEPRFRQRRQFSSQLRLSRSQLARAERIAAEIETEVTAKTTGYEAAIFGKFVELVVYLSRLYQEHQSTDAAALLRVAKVIGSIEDEFARPWHVEDFAKMAHMSRAQLMRVFRTATGQSPISYLLQLRLQKSMHLLESTDLPISTIAFEVGFNDSNYYTRQFKKTHGISPLAYRRSR